MFSVSSEPVLPGEAGCILILISRILSCDFHHYIAVRDVAVRRVTTSLAPGMRQTGIQWEVAELPHHR
jgi:hypothetical protein